MTIIQNQKNNNHRSKILIPLLLGVFAVLSIAGIYLYNQTVSLRHEIVKTKDLFNDLQAKNAELKNIAHDMENQDKLDALVADKYLVIDKNPDYIKKQQLVNRN